MAWLEFEHAYYDSTVQRFNHYSSGDTPATLLFSDKIQNKKIFSFSFFIVIGWNENHLLTNYFLAM